MLALGADRGRGHLDVLVCERAAPLAGRARPCRRARPRMGRVRPGARNTPSCRLERRELARCARPVPPWRRRRPCPPPPPAPPCVRRRSQAKPQAPSTSTRTPIPSVSASSSRSTRLLRVPTTCERRTTTRASAYDAPAPRAAATAWSHSSRTARTLVRGEPRGEGVATMPPRAGGGIGRRARLRALWG